MSSNSMLPETFMYFLWVADMPDVERVHSLIRLSVGNGPPGNCCICRPMAKLPRSTRMWKLVSSAETRRMKCPQTTTALPDSTANDFLKKFMIEGFRTQRNRSPFLRIRRSDSAPLQQWQRADAAHERIRVDDMPRSACVPLTHRRVRPCEHRATRHNRRTLPRATTRGGPKSAVACGAQTLPSRGQSPAADRENRFDALDAFFRHRKIIVSECNQVPELAWSERSRHTEQD